MRAYQRLSARVYDHDKPKPPEEAFSFYRDQVDQARSPVLEAMCGSGRFLVPLIELGYQVDGVDASGYMLASCRKRLAAIGQKSRLYETYLDQFNPEREYGLVFIPAGSFSLVVLQPAIEESLLRIHRALKDGGKLIVEVSQVRSAESYSWPWGGKWWDFPNGQRIILSWMGHYDAEKRIASSINRYELVNGVELHETEFEEFNLRHYDVSEFTFLLAEAGFTDIAATKLFSSEASEEEDETIMFTCLKPLV